jgi:signal transduction histidine kinase
MRAVTLPLVRSWRLEPRTLDLLLGVVLTALAELQVLFGHLAVGGRLLPGLSSPALGLAVVLRRRFPATVGTAAGILQALRIGLHGDPQIIPNAVSYFLALYALAVWTTSRRFAGCVVLLSALGLGAAAGPHLDLKSAVLFMVVTAVVMLLVRRVVGDRERRLALAERERDLAAREAVASERARVARELHDIVAHSVSVMVIQAQAGPRLLAEPERARGVFDSIETTGKEALTELRRLLGILREADEHADRGPQPGLDSLPTLLEQVRRAGLPVAVHVEGEPRPLPAGVDLSAYRIIQEALTNALKHAGRAEAEVRLRYGAAALELEIVDNGSASTALAPGSGHGLTGMRERVALYGGALQAGARKGHGFAVRASLPLSAGSA